MQSFIVTIKLPKNPKHDPHNKKTGACPAVDWPAECDDVTGEHHSFVWECSNGLTAETARAHWKDKGYHVTRVEGTL